MAIDPAKLKLNPHQSYTNGFFLLRVPLIINGLPAEIGYNSKGMLTLNCRDPKLGITFDCLFNDVSAIMKKNGLSGITNYWCEDVPLFQLKFSSPAGMKRFISAAETVQNELASKISAQLAEQQRILDPNAAHPCLPVVAHTEVFLLIPDPVNKDADLRAMTAENLSACLSLWKESEVFDFGALFRAHRTRHERDCGPPTLHQLLADLYDIVEWYLLGVYLDIPETDLEVIKCENDKVSDRRREMLSAWLRRYQPNWATIVTALTGIGRKSLAYKIALKYGIPTPTSVVAKPIPTPKKHDPIQQKISSQVERIKSDIQSKDVELMVRKQTSSEAQSARALAREKFKLIKHDAVQVQTRVTKLITQRIKIQKQLEQKERGLRKLQQIQEREKGELQSLIDERNEEITRLRQELEAVQAELAFEKQKASSLQEQLQQATRDLEIKSARFRELHSAHQELVTLLDSQRKMVDQLLMQQTAASNSQQQYTAEIQNQLSAARQELETKTTAMEVLRQTIAHKEEEVKDLLTQLQTQEALLQRLLTQPLQATKPDPSRELELEEELQRLTDEAAELRARLVEAEGKKQEAQRQMETAQLESRLLREFTSELRAARQPPPLKPKPPMKQLPSVEPRAAVSQSSTVKPKPAVRKHAVPLHLGAPLNWEHCTDLPVGMRYTQAVVVGNKMYVGGGNTLTIATDYNIYSCDFTGDNTWKTINSPTRQSALTTYQERLVLVGGVRPYTNTPTNQLWMTEDDQAWIQPFPPMPTPRYGASAVNSQKQLIVAGGKGYGGNVNVDVVEVYNGQQWVRADPLPKCCYFMNATLHDGFLYLMGGEPQGKSVFQHSVQAVIKQATPHPTKESTWNTTCDAPYYGCSVANFGGALVAVGGYDNGPKNSLHMYDPVTQSWVHAGKMPVAVGSTCTITLPSGEMMVIGGQTKHTGYSHLVYKASLQIEWHLN